MKDRLIRWLIARLGEESRRGTFMADATWERSEELRVDRLGPTHDDLVVTDRGWRLPRGLERPRRQL